MKKLLIILISLVAIVAIAVATYKIVFTTGKIDVCTQIEPGTTLEEFINKIGKPIHETVKDDEYWILFASDTFAAGPISIRIDIYTNAILELRCTEDGKSEWVIDKK